MFVFLFGTGHSVSGFLFVLFVVHKVNSVETSSCGHGVARPSSVETLSCGHGVAGPRVSVVEASFSSIVLLYKQREEDPKKIKKLRESL